MQIIHKIYKLQKNGTVYENILRQNVINVT